MATDPILVAAVAASHHELRDVWASFYPATHAFAVGLARGLTAVTFPYGVTLDWTGRVADCVAALSPQVAWDYNMTLATRAVDLYADGDHDLRGLAGQTRANVRNAASSLNGNGPGNGPKVNAFARNIRGDWDVVTVDRHMLVCAGYSDKRPTTRARRDVDLRVRRAADRIGEAPATTQALVWGYHRHTKGYQTYY